MKIRENQLIMATADYFNISVSELLSKEFYLENPTALEILVSLAAETLEPFTACDDDEEQLRRRIILHTFPACFRNHSVEYLDIQDAGKNSYEKSKSDADFRKMMKDILSSIENGNYPLDDFEILDNVLIQYHGNATILSISDPPSIGSGAFSHCNTLEHITIQEGITRIPTSAFLDCENLVEVVLPESLLLIENGAFSGCNKLNKINIPSKLTAIGDFAFCFCHVLENISFPDSLAKIGRFAFSDCNKLTEIRLPRGLKEIGEAAFAECRSLTNVDISGETEIHNTAFRNTPWIARNIE